MFSLTVINFRRIAIACLLAIALFGGSALKIGNDNTALAEVLKRDAVDLSREEVGSEAEIQAAKAKRRAMQAEMSQRAKDDGSESVSDKLNLDEPVPQSTKEFIRDLGKDDSINSKLRP